MYAVVKELLMGKDNLGKVFALLGIAWSILVSESARVARLLTVKTSPLRTCHQLSIGNERPLPKILVQ